jgi:hypothetical protein
MDEPVPIRRAAVGCLLLGLAAVAAAIVLRLAVFSLAPLRDDSAVVVATATEVAAGPIQREVLLSRSRGWSGERDAGDGHVQLSVILAPSTTFGSVSAVNAASPGRSDCPVEIDADRLTDCEGRSWTFDGYPIDSADPALERIGVRVETGSVVLDLTRQATE